MFIGVGNGRMRNLHTIPIASAIQARAGRRHRVPLSRRPVPLHKANLRRITHHTIMKLKTLQDLFIYELQDLYSAETQLIKALPKMAKAAAHDELKAAFEEHFEQTKIQVGRLEQIAEICKYKLTGHKCKAMEGLIQEGAELISEDAEDAVRDAGLIGAAQRVEHYEIAAYGTARALAACLGYDEVAELLGETLEEERETDETLTEIAEGVINVEAAEAPQAGN